MSHFSFHPVFLGFDALIDSVGYEEGGFSQPLTGGSLLPTDYIPI